MTEPLSPDQIFIRKMTDIIHANLENEDFGVNELSKEAEKPLQIGKETSFNGRKVNQFIRETRSQKALEILQDTEYSVSEVAYKVGFGSPAYFNHCFHSFFGYPPGVAREGPVSSQVHARYFVLHLLIY